MPRTLTCHDGPHRVTNVDMCVVTDGSTTTQQDEDSLLTHEAEQVKARLVDLQLESSRVAFLESNEEGPDDDEELWGPVWRCVDSKAHHPALNLRPKFDTADTLRFQNGGQLSLGGFHLPFGISQTDVEVESTSKKLSKMEPALLSVTVPLRQWTSFESSEQLDFGELKTESPPRDSDTGYAVNTEVVLIEAVIQARLFTLLRRLARDSDHPRDAGLVQVRFQRLMASA